MMDERANMCISFVSFFFTFCALRFTSVVSTLGLCPVYSLWRKQETLTDEQKIRDITLHMGWKLIRSWVGCSGVIFISVFFSLL